VHVAPMASGRQMAAGSVLPRPQREGRQGQGRQANFEEVGAFVLHGRGALREEQRHCVRRGRGAGRARRCRAWHCTRWAEPPRDLRGSTGAMLSKRPRLRRRARRPHLVHPHRLHHVVHTAGVPHPRAPRGVRRRRVRERPAPLGLHRERPVRAAPEVGQMLQHRRGSLRAHVRARMGARGGRAGGRRAVHAHSGAHGLDAARLHGALAARRRGAAQVRERPAPLPLQILRSRVRLHRGRDRVGAPCGADVLRGVRPAESGIIRLATLGADSRGTSGVYGRSRCPSDWNLPHPRRVDKQPAALLLQRRGLRVAPEHSELSTDTYTARLGSCGPYRIAEATASGPPPSRKRRLFASQLCAWTAAPGGVRGRDCVLLVRVGALQPAEPSHCRGAERRRVA
jgi:hypothetical protein